MRDGFKFWSYVGLVFRIFRLVEIKILGMYRRCLEGVKFFRR